jgi:2-polyprenyl-6-methoxyphenol hydroxylase-like FAD-dependent oxidoreductase
MPSFDVAIVGAGLAGSLAATMLGRAGYAVALVDPHAVYRPDFRCEKLEDGHVEGLRRAGVLDEVLPATRRYRGIWVARLGRLAERKPATEFGIDYTALVNRMRTLVPANVTVLQDKAVDIALTADRQTVTLAHGEAVTARLVIAANGLNAAMLGALGMGRRTLSRNHSISIGFDVEPVTPFPFEALTYFGESPEHRVSYLTLFPLSTGVRANLFVYRASDDPWLREMRETPDAALDACLPRLKQLTGDFRVTSPVKIRPVDLYVTENVRQPGIALVGDAFATACPTSGLGAVKAITDVERLCNVHIPQWLASDGMGAGKIASFYADPVKLRSDAHAAQTSLFAKRLALEQGFAWSAYRWARYTGSVARDTVHRSMRTLHSGTARASAH